MAITLMEAKVGMADKVDAAVVDMFRRSSALLEAMPFDNAISPGSGGSTLSYGYIQLKTPGTAAVRTVGENYVSAEAKKEKKTTCAIIMGGAFEVDRVIQNTSGAEDEVAFQAEQKVKATANLFHNMVVNGDTEAGGFDGLNKLLHGTANEMVSAVSIASSAELDENYNAFLDEMDGFVASLDGTPSLLLMNSEMLVKLRGVARRAGYYQRSQDDFGNFVETYAGIPMVDMGRWFNGETTEQVIPTAEGKTDIYAVCLGLDGLHGISPLGTGVIQSYLPDMNAPGAVKQGEVELVAGIALKNTNKAAVLRGVTIG